MDFSDIVGNRELKRKLSDDITSDNISHAYIIEGACGSGRHTVAKNIAAALSCRGEANIPCGRCPSCEKIFGNKSPDIITVGLEGGKASIGVDAVRFLKSDIYVAPNDLDVKVYLIEDADRMTVQAQNAFLLSLEEPPSYVLFFLLCENASLMLETVRSRAPIIRTEKIEDALIDSYLTRNTEGKAEELKNSDPALYRELIFVSDGCIGRALELICDVKARKYLFSNRALAKDLISAAANGSKTDIIEKIYSMSTKRNEVADMLICFQTAIRDLLLLQRSENVRLCFYCDRDEASDMAERITAGKLMNMYCAISDALYDLSRNANVRLLLINTVSRFTSV